MTERFGRCVSVGGTALALCGGIAGLTVGLFAYPPTAWFAVFELGIPAGLLGAALGALCDGALALRDKLHR